MRSSPSRRPGESLRQSGVWSYPIFASTLLCCIGPFIHNPSLTEHPCTQDCFMRLPGCPLCTTVLALFHRHIANPGAVQFY